MSVSTVRIDFGALVSSRTPAAFDDDFIARFRYFITTFACKDDGLQKRYFKLVKLSYAKKLAGILAAGFIFAPAVQMLSASIQKIRFFVL